MSTTANQTVDTTRRADAAAREATIRRNAVLCAVNGIGFAIITTIAALWYQQSTDHEPPTVLTVMCLAISVSLIWLWALEYSGRSVRAALRDQAERMDVLEAAMAKVPDYGDALLIGAQLAVQVVAPKTD